MFIGNLIVGMGTIVAMALLIAYLYDQAVRLSNWWKDRKRYSSSNQLYDNLFIDVKEFYVRKYGTLPWMLYVSEIDAKPVHELIQSGNYGRLMSV